LVEKQEIEANMLRGSGVFPLQGYNGHNKKVDYASTIRQNRLFLLQGILSPKDSSAKEVLLQEMSI
jgi:hypothetical protein